MTLEQIFSVELLRAMTRLWRAFLVLELSLLAIALVLFFALPREYKVTATVIGIRYSSDVTPSSGTQTLSASALFGRSTNSLPPVTDFGLFTRLLTSTELGKELLNDDIMADIFPLEKKNGHWVRIETSGLAVKNFVNSMLGRSPSPLPDGYAVAERLRTLLSIEPEKDSQVITLSYVGKRPEMGIALIKTVQARADGMVKRLAQRRLKDKVDFLKRELAETQIQESRNVLGNTLVKAETDHLYSESNLPFAAEFLAPPAADSTPVSPELGKIVGSFLLLGIVAYFIFAVAALQGYFTPFERLDQLLRQRSY